MWRFSTYNTVLELTEEGNAYVKLSSNHVGWTTRYSRLSFSMVESFILHHTYALIT